MECLLPQDTEKHLYRQLIRQSMWSLTIKGWHVIKPLSFSSSLTVVWKLQFTLWWWFFHMKQENMTKDSSITAVKGHFLRRGNNFTQRPPIPCFYYSSHSYLHICILLWKTKAKTLFLFSQWTGCQRNEHSEFSIVSWMWMLILNSHLFFSLQGYEQHSEEFAVWVVLCGSAPTGENNMAVPLWDPAKDQPVSAFILPRSLSPFYFSIISTQCLIGIYMNNAVFPLNSDCPTENLLYLLKMLKSIHSLTCEPTILILLLKGFSHKLYPF